MSVDKLVDSTQLDSDLASVADAIRAKSGGSGQLAFPAGFVSEIGNISSGETYLMAPKTGQYYVPKIEQTLTGYGTNFYGQAGRWGSCEDLEELIIHGLTGLNNVSGRICASCPKLKKLLLPDLAGSTNSFVVTSCTALTEIQLGSIGHAMTGLYANAFSGCTNENLVITIYVKDTETISLANSPWGATNATIVYRSSTDGSVRTP